KKMRYLILNLAGVLALATGAINLCRKDLCPDNEVHAGCFHSKTKAQKCSKGTYVINVNGGLRLKIMEAVNIFRNYVASGVGNFSIAARMPMMGWDYSLQRLADLQIRQCDTETYFCANTEKYHYVATTEISGTMRRRANLAKVVLEKFLPELLNDALGCRMDSGQRLHPLSESHCHGHYVPLIEDYGNRMGCAVRVAADQGDPEKVSLVLLCHFSRANVNGLNHYEVGTTATEKCTTGASPLYQFLCSPAENVDANSLLVHTEMPSESEMAGAN
ncbi:hypothetical protein KR018_002525, partial [Drosophila ironensis]